MPFENLSGLQYPQFQILLSLVSIQKSMKNNLKASAICIIEILCPQGKRMYYQHMQRIVKDLSPLIPGFHPKKILCSSSALKNKRFLIS